MLLGMRSRPSDLSRRSLLRRLAVGAAALPFISACGSDDAAAGPDASTGIDAGASGDAPAGNAWASGGTAAMTDQASYPDPFTVAPAACALVATTTLGPCTTATELVRRDVSEGWTGIPVRLALKVVDASCAPLAGVTVRIWHTNIVGSYSGQTPNNSLCLAQASYATMDFFRGAQVTDAAGVVAFDTCFPGWYAGRAIHIHFQILTNGASTRVSQLFFPEDVTTAIFAAHPEYASYGQPDTSLTTDGIVRAIPLASRAPLILEVARMTDGAMLASKVVSVTG